MLRPGVAAAVEIVMTEIPLLATKDALTAAGAIDEPRLDSGSASSTEPLVPGAVTAPRSLRSNLTHPQLIRASPLKTTGERSI